ncbi:transporter substrate-binding domain-containing protein [Profundibacter sp.]
MTDMRRNSEIVRADQFSQMLDMVEDGRVDAAIANISITAKREGRFDFSQPVFESGLQIMIHSDSTNGASIWRAYSPRICCWPLPCHLPCCLPVAC